MNKLTPPEMFKRFKTKRNLLFDPYKRTLGQFLLVSIFLTGSVFFSSCSQEKPDEADAIRTQISEYNAQILELSQKVSTLEKELELMGEKPQNRVRTPVGVTEMLAQPFDHYFRVNANVEAIREATISPETNGQIKQIMVSKGQMVTRGQVLARLNTSVIENNISEIKTSLQLAQTVYNRQKRLWEQEIGSEIQYLEAKNNYESLQTRLKAMESQFEMAVMRAPFEGVVDEIFVKEGELAMPGIRVMQIINLNQLYINADVSENFLPMINPNDRVILRFPAFPDYEQYVPIHRVGNVINPENRTFRLQLRIDNPGERFKPNMIASMGILSYSADEALVVPSILIKQDIQGHFVYVAQKNNGDDLVAKKVYVERGLDGEGRTMIKDGLEPGDLLINQGHNQVTDGTLIEIIEKRNLASSEK
jgi:membrane fusion protein, multidrug efflux system